jgi:hypothetical protein
VVKTDGVTARGVRVSVVARSLLERVALALGGRAGARLGLGVDRMTLLRAIRAMTLPAPPPVKEAKGIRVDPASLAGRTHVRVVDAP